jgi:hypothetical protein
MGHPSLWELFWGTWRGDSFARGQEGYERKALGLGISPHGGSVGQPGVGSSARDFEIWLTRALGVECPSLYGSSVKGTWREGSSTGDFERWMKGALCMKRLYEEALWRGSGGSPSLGTLEDVLGKSLDVGFSMGAPFQLRGTRFVRGLVHRGLC